MKNFKKALAVILLSLIASLSAIPAFANPPHQVSLAWVAPTTRVDTSPITGVLTYVVTRNGVVLTTIPISALAYQDSTVIGGQVYNYSIQAIESGGGTSVASVSVQATIAISNPNPPSGVNITSSN